jgi:hypothetical protein
MFTLSKGEVSFVIDSGLETLLHHKHQHLNVYPYEFESAYQLLEDFWTDVNDVTG